MKLRILGILLSVSVMALPVGAETPIGSQFQINTYTTSIQTQSSVSAEADGDFVVVWTSLVTIGPFISKGNIHAQRYRSSGALAGGEFQVNTQTTGSQTAPSVSSDEDGDFVVVWIRVIHPGLFPSGFIIVGQRFNSLGSMIGAEFQTNNITTGNQSSPSVSSAADGGFVVVWNSYGLSSSDTVGFGVVGQRYDSNGSVVGAEFQVNSYTTFDQEAPSVSSNADGGFVVVWDSNGSDGSDSSGDSIQGQRFDSDGLTIGSEFQVNSYSTNHQRFPVVVTETSGGFMVVWRSERSSGSDSSLSSIQGRRYNSSGSPLADDFQINSYSTGFQVCADVTADTAGDFVVVWMSNGSNGTDSSESSIQGQRIGADGLPVGSEYQVNTYTTDIQNCPAVAGQADNGMVVTWGSVGSDDTDTSESSIQGQLFSSPRIFRDGFESGDTSAWSGASL